MFRSKKHKELLMKLRFGNLLIVFILALCLIFSLSACATPEEEDPNGEEIPPAGEEEKEDALPSTVTENGLTFSLLSDNTYTVAGFDNSTPTVTIPATVKGANVTAISEQAFYACDKLTGVVMGANIKTIGTRAFWNCTALVNIELPSAVTALPWGIFENCSSLEAITIPKGVKTIENEAFLGCSSLRALTFEEGSVCESIATNAFSYCGSLISVKIPNTVTAIGNAVFSECYGLTSVTIGTGVTSIGYGAFENCYRLVEVYNFSGLNVEAGSTENGRLGFYATVVYTEAERESLLSTTNDGFILFPHGDEYYTLISYVGSQTEVTIPETVVKIRDYAFYRCYDITSITIGKSVATIGNEVFTDNKSLVSIVVDEENESFASVDGVLFDHDVATIVKYPEAISASTYEIPETVTTIGSRAFYRCNNLRHITIPVGVLEIGKGAFSECANLTTVVIGNGVTTVGENAFSNCKRLTSVTLGSAITTINDYAFSDCFRLVEVINHSTLDIIAGKTANGQVSYSALYVETDPDEASRLSTDEDGFVIYTTKDNVRVVVDYLGSESVISIPEDVTVINSYALHNNDIITSVTVGEGVTAIGKYAFHSCDSLTGVVFESTAGWWRSVMPDATTGNEIPAADLASTETAATYLKSTYFTSFWKKNNA